MGGCESSLRTLEDQNSWKKKRRKGDTDHNIPLVIDLDAEIALSVPCVLAAAAAFVRKKFFASEAAAAAAAAATSPQPKSH